MTASFHPVTQQPKTPQRKDSLKNKLTKSLTTSKTIKFLKQQGHMASGLDGSSDLEPTATPPGSTNAASPPGWSAGSYFDTTPFPVSHPQPKSPTFKRRHVNNIVLARSQVIYNINDVVKMSTDTSAFPIASKASSDESAYPIQLASPPKVSLLDLPVPSRESEPLNSIISPRYKITSSLHNVPTSPKHNMASRSASNPPLTSLPPPRPIPNRASPLLPALDGI